MAKAPPIDFAATRRGIVAAVAEATGLPPSRVIRAQGQGAVQPLPPHPFCTFQFRTVGMRAGQDAVVAAPELGPTLWRYVGEKGISVDFNFYADGQDEAYNLALLWQLGLEQQPTREILESFGMSVWTVSDATDVTALLSTGFEARAFLECELWLGTEMVIDLSSMETVTAIGTVVQEDDSTALTTTVTVNTARGN